MTSCFAKDKDYFQLPELELIIDDSLDNTITVYGWFLPGDHELYTRGLCFINNMTVSNLIRDTECQFICPGVSPIELTGQVILPAIPKIVDTFYYTIQYTLYTTTSDTLCLQVKHKICFKQITMSVWW